MEGSDALSALAEVAIGIAGFAAIALVLSRSRDSLSPDILLVIRTMIVWRVCSIPRSIPLGPRVRDPSAN